VDGNGGADLTHEWPEGGEVDFVTGMVENWGEKTTVGYALRRETETYSRKGSGLGYMEANKAVAFDPRERSLELQGSEGALELTKYRVAAVQSNVQCGLQGSSWTLS